MRKYTAVLWDFNGTIMDDAGAALGAVNDMLTKRHQPQIDLDRYREAIVTPIWGFYEEIFEPHTITMEEAIVEFDEGYNRHLGSNPLMSGCTETLQFFGSIGIRQLVVSSSHIDKVTSLLRDFGIDGYFENVLALSDYYAGDKTHLAKAYLESEGILSESAIVVGDCLADFYMARTLGCDAVLFSAGHQHRARLETAGVPVIDSLSELKNFIS